MKRRIVGDDSEAVDHSGCILSCKETSNIRLKE